MYVRRCRFVAELLLLLCSAFLSTYGQGQQDCNSETHFRCDNGRCIVKYLQCDRYNDCGDLSDERNCKCTENEFKCRNGWCVFRSLKCNGYDNCGDGSDEEGCNPPTPCAYNQFMCLSDSRCLHTVEECFYNNCPIMQFVCDGYVDCVDGSDEFNCPARNTTTSAPATTLWPMPEFQCQNGRVIVDYKRCDMFNDCGDYSDEIGCECNALQYRCRLGNCIYYGGWCDKVLDCPDGSDEPPNCEEYCPSSMPMFRCENKICVPEVLRCDGTNDCYDNSDERNCANYCPATQFICDNGVCLRSVLQCNKVFQCKPMQYVCDGYNDCPDNSDELRCNITSTPSALTTTETPDLEYFQCNNGRRVSRYSVCDYFNDCGDFSDETNCNCTVSQFKCDIGTCIPNYFHCDGYKDCPDGSDELNNCSKECRDGTTSCPDQSYCLSSRDFCDGFYDCRDHSDETNCTCQDENSIFTRFQCGNGNCVSSFLVCNNYNDCGNWMDERNCTCYYREHFQCAVGKCLHIHHWCNGAKDCPDGDDEPDDCANRTHCPAGFVFCQRTNRCISEDKNTTSDCECQSYQYQCQNSKCIYVRWLCDGIRDCPNGDDESPELCGACAADRYQCQTDYTCVESEDQCDGVSQCFDRTDEMGCVETQYGNKFTVARYRGEWGYRFCSAGWSHQWSDALCKFNGYAESNKTTLCDVTPGDRILLIDKWKNCSMNPLTSVYEGYCSTGKVVDVSCKSKECGVGLDVITPRIVNGESAVLGAYPWYVALVIKYQNHFRFCGGSLINSRWIVTAAHCIEFVNSPDDVSVTLGTVLLKEREPGSVTLKADRTIVYPEYNRRLILNDIGLIRLAEEVSFTNTIRPVCLPTTTFDIESYKSCIAAGLGFTAPDAPLATSLQFVRMDFLPLNLCQNLVTEKGLFGELDARSHICAGGIQGESAVCSGDSGGPYICQDFNNRWTLIGVTSGGDYDCTLSIFTNVTAFTNFINTVIYETEEQDIARTV